MQADRVISKIELSSDNILTVYDQTRVYFGDYYHVKLVIKGDITSPDSAKTAAYHRILEKMAVPSANVDTAINSLLSEFVGSSLPYLNSPDFVEKFIASSTSRKTTVIQRSPWTLNRA